MYIAFLVECHTLPIAVLRVIFDDAPSGSAELPAMSRLSPFLRLTTARFASKVLCYLVAQSRPLVEP